MTDFDMPEMSQALNDVSNLPDASKALPPKNAAALEAARAKGWAEPTGYDYSKYVNAGLTEQAANGFPGHDAPQWTANAAKYEWKDEYGDIGPANADLEEMLFRSEYINRSGLKLNK